MFGDSLLQTVYAEPRVHAVADSPPQYARRVPVHDDHTTDGGGSNSHRVRLWKFELGRLAQEIGMDVDVHRFLSGTSKWNKIEHRLFSLVTMNWRGRPVIVTR